MQARSTDRDPREKYNKSRSSMSSTDVIQKRTAEELDLEEAELIKVADLQLEDQVQVEDQQAEHQLVVIMAVIEIQNKLMVVVFLEVVEVVVKLLHLKPHLLKQILKILLVKQIYKHILLTINY